MAALLSTQYLRISPRNRYNASLLFTFNLGLRDSMKRFFKRFSIFLALTCIFVPFLASAFLVKNIQFYGLQRVSTSTALSYVPLKPGQDYTSEAGDNILRTLYKTGFFSNVRISRRANTLVITVVEQRTISLINIDGNKAVKYEDLQKVLKKMGIVVGNPFDGSKVHMIVVGLEQEYGQLGYHAVDVTTDVKNAPNNTVALYIHVEEGVIAKVATANELDVHALKVRLARLGISVETVVQSKKEALLVDALTAGTLEAAIPLCLQYLQSSGLEERN